MTPIPNSAPNKNSQNYLTPPKCLQSYSEFTITDSNTMVFINQKKLVP
jgi:hypothetical protein